MSPFRQVVARRASAKLALALAAAAVVAVSAWRPDRVDGPVPSVATESGTVSLASLPAQAQRTKLLIAQGGPFPYDKDSTVFHNRERLLPPHPRGYYREYTVTTPGAGDRGARRIVCGGDRPTAPDACYYSADHYASFRRIEP